MITTYTINHNEQFNSLEVSFNGKPSEAIREALKALRFRWHGVKKIWYGFADENKVKEAIDKAAYGFQMILNVIVTAVLAVVVLAHVFLA